MGFGSRVAAAKAAEPAKASWFGSFKSAKKPAAKKDDKSAPKKPAAKKDDKSAPKKPAAKKGDTKKK